MTDPVGGSAFQPASDLLRNAENTATAASRRLDGALPDWGLLVAEAQAAVGSFQPGSVAVRVREFHDEQAASPLIAAARIVFDAARHAPLSGEDQDHSERERLRLLASCTYAMYGNFPSAAAAQATISPDYIFSDAEWTAVGLSNPRRLFEALSNVEIFSPFYDLLHSAYKFTLSGSSDDANIFTSHVGPAILACQSIGEAALVRCCRTISAQIIYLACANMRRMEYGSTFLQYVENVISNGRYCLLPPQSDIIWSNKFIESRSNALVTIPTSTGKTLLAELAIAKAIEKPGSVCVYVAPYVALGRQVYDCIKENAPSYVNVIGSFGSFNNNTGGVDPFGRNIIIATPERFDAILRTGGVINLLTTVVFDEAHGIENGARGVRLEGLIARLKLQQRTNSNLRIILLSAVLTNSELVKGWLGPDAVHFDHSWRPTARRIGFWMTGGRLAWLYGNDPLRPPGVRALDQVGFTQLDWPTAISPTEHPGGVERHRASSFGNVAHLATYLERQHPGPVLIACYTKGSTRGVATAVAALLPDEVSLPNLLVDLITMIETSFSHLKPLAKMLRRGVAYHNASLPSEVKAALEEAIRDRALRFVAATTTLAEGVDMPFRTTIIYEWLTGFGANQSPMSALMFRNIAGRCGRAGQYVEGDTVVYDNVLGRLEFTSNENRRSAQSRVLSDPPPLSSAVANDNASPEEAEALRAALSGQLLASIPENPNADRVDQELAAATYAARIGSSPAVALASIRAELLDTSQGEPFAMAASPMWLTDLGHAANSTGFSARTCRQMMQFIRTASVKPSSELAADVLDQFGLIAEQSSYVLRDIAARKTTQFYVKADDLAFIAAHWLSAAPFLEVFTALPRARRSKAQVTPAQWAAGEAEYERVASQYDKFVDLMEYAFGNYLPWVFRAFAQLAPHVDRDTPMPDWAAIEDEFNTARDPDGLSIDDILNQPTGSE